MANSELQPYVRNLADQMGLRDWQIIVTDDEPDVDAYWAAVQRVHGQKRARLFLRGDWQDWEPEQLRQTLVHELLHLHIDPVAQSAMNSIGELVTDDVYHVAWTRMMEDVEYAVDGIAEAWASQFTLPWAYAKHIEVGDVA